MKLSIICAMDEKRGIGKNNKIPWHIRDDLIKLKSLTKDHIVILGRKTYDSMVWYYDKSGKQLPGKIYIVVTRDKDYKPARENAVVAHSLEEATEISGSVIAIRQLAEKQSQVEGIASSPTEHTPVKQANSDFVLRSRNDTNNNEVFIIGGGQIYQQALSFADKLYLTIVEGDYQCDTFFPDYSEFKKIISEEQKESEGHKYKFLEVEK